MPFNTFISQPKSSLIIHTIMFKHSSLFPHQLIHMIRPSILSFQSIIIHYCLCCKQAISGLMIYYKFTPIQQIDMHSDRNPRLGRKCSSAAAAAAAAASSSATAVTAQTVTIYTAAIRTFRIRTKRVRPQRIGILIGSDYDRIAYLAQRRVRVRRAASRTNETYIDRTVF